MTDTDVDPGNIVDPAVMAAADPALAADPPAPDPALETPPAAQPNVADVERRSFINQLTELRTRLRDTESEAAKQRREAQEARDLAERLARGDKDAPAASAAKPAPRPGDPDWDTAVQQAAASQRRVEAVTDAIAEGRRSIGNVFQDSLKALDAYYGDDALNIASAAVSIDKAKAHQILHTIGQDPDLAMRLGNMDPTQRIVELTRMSMAAAAPAKTDPKTLAAAATPAAAAATPPKKVSAAPPPPPPVEPSASKVVDWRDDKASDSEFAKGWEENMANRMKRQRGR